MKHNGRKVENFSIGILIKGENPDNPKFVASTLYDNNIKGWGSLEGVLDNYILITPNRVSVEATNQLFADVKRVFEDVNITIHYEEFNDQGHNILEIYEPLTGVEE